ncbi:MAG: enolase C-terminal domain-like protein [Planctomycetota bacterium]|nr:enolase C-terminal domain-like protein [Planctomycetota bacterium]
MSAGRLSRRSLLKRAAIAPAVVGLGVASCAAPGQGLGRTIEADLAPDADAAGPRITRIDLWSLRYPMVGYFKFFAGAHGAAGRAAVMVRVTLEDGTVGWGQSVPIAKWSDETLETATVALAEYLAPALLGHDVLGDEDFRRAHHKLDLAIAPGYSTGMPIARAGLDLALHDLKGKLLGVNVAQLWGKEPATEPLELSWTVNARSIAEVSGLVGAGRARGYRHFNIKVGPDPGYDEELALEVRRLAPDCFLWADANGGYDKSGALVAAKLLARAGVDVLEAPLRPNHISGYRALVLQGALPILMDEGVSSPLDAEEFHKIGMHTGLAMKPARCGGLESNRRQIEYCEKNDLLWLGSGLTDPDVSLAATLCLYGAYGLQKPAALNGPQFLTADLLVEPLRIEAGRAWAPTGPGLGVDVDLAALEDLAARTAAEAG